MKMIAVENRCLYCLACTFTIGKNTQGPRGALAQKQDSYKNTVLEKQLSDVQRKWTLKYDSNSMPKLYI